MDALAAPATNIDALAAPATNIDALAPIRAEVARGSGGLPSSLVVRLHAVQGRILDAIRERFPDPADSGRHAA